MIVSGGKSIVISSHLFASLTLFVVNFFVNGNWGKDMEHCD